MKVYAYIKASLAACACLNGVDSGLSTVTFW